MAASNSTISCQKLSDQKAVRVACLTLQQHLITALPMKSTLSFVLHVNKATFKVEHCACQSVAYDLAQLEQMHFWAVLYHCVQCKQKQLVEKLKLTGRCTCTLHISFCIISSCKHATRDTQVVLHFIDGTWLANTNTHARSVCSKICSAHTVTPAPVDGQFI